MSVVNMRLAERQVSCSRWELAHDLAYYLLFHTYNGLDKIKSICGYDSEVVGLTFPIVFCDQEPWFDQHRAKLVELLEKGLDNFMVGHSAMYSLESGGYETITHIDCIHKCMKAEQIAKDNNLSKEYRDLNLFIIYDTIRGLMNTLNVDSIKIVR
jgi:hypothetical protein